MIIFEKELGIINCGENGKKSWFGHVQRRELDEPVRIVERVDTMH